MKNIANRADMKLPIAIDQKGENWVQSTLAKMTLDEKIGQLIHVAAWSNKSESHVNKIDEVVAKYKIGGLIFFQGNPINQAQLTNRYQTISDIPLLISIDAEWGLGMRLDEVESFPYQITLGALQHNDLIYEMGKAVGKQLKRVGVNLNHAPVVDVNTNPKNPVISFRSFGEDPKLVAEKGKAYMKGLQAELILACAKHFPGHGDTSVDSHFDLPVLNKTKKELVDVEFFPFKKLIGEGLGAVMTAHLLVPKVDSEEKRASTLSKIIIDNILKKELGFQGLVLTDALDMKAVADYFDKGKLEVEALKAGNDVLLFVEDVEIAVSEIKLAILKGEISEQDLNEKCAKQLAYKYWMGLMNFKPIQLDNILVEVNKSTSFINGQIYAQSMTLLKKEASFPAKESNTILISIFAKGDEPEEGSLNHHTILKSVFGNGEVPIFEKEMSEYFDDSTQISIHENQIKDFDLAKVSVFKNYENIILSIHNVKLKCKDDFGFSTKMLAVIQQVLSVESTHLVFFGNAYAMDKIANLKPAKSILLAYQENQYTHNYASKILKNEMMAHGKLPVSINEEFTYGAGITN